MHVRKAPAGGGKVAAIQSLGFVHVEKQPRPEWEAISKEKGARVYKDENVPFFAADLFSTLGEDAAQLLPQNWKGNEMWFFWQGCADAA